MRTTITIDDTLYELAILSSYNLIQPTDKETSQR